MTFREFVDGTRAAVEAGVAGMRGERAMTPAIHLDTPFGVQIFGLEPEFFTDAVARRRLREHVRPLLQGYTPQQAAWSFFAEIEGDDHAVIVAVDGERTECWLAPVYRYPDQPPTLGVWAGAEPNMQVGVLVDIQEDMR